eukprot:1195859-Prorocentrum_minimum.AAC.4
MRKYRVGQGTETARLSEESRSERYRVVRGSRGTDREGEREHTRGGHRSQKGRENILVAGTDRKRGENTPSHTCKGCVGTAVTKRAPGPLYGLGVGV